MQKKGPKGHFLLPGKKRENVQGNNHDSLNKDQLFDDPVFLKDAILGRKFHLDCGHVVTFGHNLGNNVVIINGAEPQFICTNCYN